MGNAMNKLNVFNVYDGFNSRNIVAGKKVTFLDKTFVVESITFSNDYDRWLAALVPNSLAEVKATLFIEPMYLYPIIEVVELSITKIEALKVIRLIHNIGLKQAKDLCEFLMDKGYISCTKGQSSYLATEYDTANRDNAISFINLNKLVQVMSEFKDSNYEIYTRLTLSI